MLSNISDAIEGKWCVAVVTFTLEEDVGELKCMYIKDRDSNVERNFDVSDEICELFNALHEVNKDEEGRSWKRAKLTLFPVGMFHVDFE